MKQLAMTARPWLAVALVAAAALLVSGQTAEAGHGYYGPTVTKCYVVQSPECPSLCTTISVCLPACCADEEPCVSSRCTLIGQGQVRLSWSCGKTVTVRFTRHGVRVF